MLDFKKLLKHQNKENKISEIAFGVLIEYTENVIEEWK